MQTPDPFRSVTDLRLAHTRLFADETGRRKLSGVVAGLRAFWPKLVSGGMILVHDYNSFQFEGVKKTVQLFCREKGLPALPLAGLHGSAILLRQA